MTIRQMTEHDLSFAAACTNQAGWATETEQELSALYNYCADGCFIGDENGKPVAICVAIGYGLFGFIGEMIVSPDCRGRGIGRALMMRAIDYLHQTGARDIYLDGVPKAVPLYERLGFRKICRSLRYRCKIDSPQDPAVRRMTSADLPNVSALDREAFGADRLFFLANRLKSYPNLSFVRQEGTGISGYAQGRVGQNVVSIGPWISRDNAADSLGLVHAIAAAAGTTPLRMGVLDDNRAMIRAARAFDFEPSDNSPWRMVHGPGNNPESTALVLAIGSPAKG